MQGRAREHQVSYAAGLLRAAFQADRRQSAGQLPLEVEEAVAETMGNLAELASDHLVACKRSSGLSDPEAGWEERTWGADYAKNSNATLDYLGILQLLLEDPRKDPDNQPDDERTAYLCLVQHFEVLVVTGAPIPWILAEFILKTMRQPHVVPSRLGKPPLPSNRNQIIHDTIENVAQAFQLRPTRGDTAAETVVSACDVLAEAMDSLGMRPSNFETIRKLWYSHRSYMKRERELDDLAGAELEDLTERPDWPEIRERFRSSLSPEDREEAEKAARDGDAAHMETGSER